MLCVVIDIGIVIAQLLIKMFFRRLDMRLRYALFVILFASLVIHINCAESEATIIDYSQDLTGSVYYSHLEVYDSPPDTTYLKSLDIDRLLIDEICPLKLFSKFPLCISHIFISLFLPADNKYLES